MQRTVTYFDKPGPKNTGQCLEIVKETIDNFNYKHIVVATTTGKTGQIFAESLRDKKKCQFDLNNSFTWI
jgi:hypothetical protein